MFETFWRRHYHPGVTGSFHGDMAHAYALIVADPESKFYAGMLRDLWRSVRIHVMLERMPTYTGGRKWFCEQFGSLTERI